MVEPDVGVPQRVPEKLRDPGDLLRGHVGVQEHQIEVGVGNHFAAAQTAGGDDGEAAALGDPQIGRLGGQPQFVQIQQCLTQGRGVEPTLAAGQELPSRRGKVGGRLRRLRRRGSPIPGGGAICALGHLNLAL